MKEENRYPTDEELLLFIENLETEELYAPRHLKEEILRKADMCTGNVTTAENMVTHVTVAGNSAKRPEKSPVSFLSYTVKVVAGMAAALLLTFTVPVGDGSELSYAKERAQRMQERMEEETKEHEESLLKAQQRKSIDEIVTEYMNEKRSKNSKLAESDMEE